MMESGIQCGMHTSHVGHATYGYEKVLEKGLLGVKADAERRLDEIDRADPDQQRTVAFMHQRADLSSLPKTVPERAQLPWIQFPHTETADQPFQVGQ